MENRGTEEVPTGTDNNKGICVKINSSVLKKNGASLIVCKLAFQGIVNKVKLFPPIFYPTKLLLFLLFSIFKQSG